MKKSLFGILLIITAASCTNGNKSEAQKKPVENSVYKTLNGVDYNKKAKKMIDDFSTNYKKDNNLKSLSEWYSKDNIRNMLVVLKDERKKVDGVRFYFGAESINLKPSQNVKIKTKILLVTTSKREVPTGTTLSIHGDYFDHKDGYIALKNETGNDVYDHARRVKGEGGLLYSDNQPDFGIGLCTTKDPHMIPDSEAYLWVQKRHDKKDKKRPSRRDSSPFNTISEWFDICFISSLFDKIVSDKELTGLRVYGGKGFQVDGIRDQRDVFILVPTYTKGIERRSDYYGCIDLYYVSPCNLPGSEQFINGKKRNQAKLNELFDQTYLKSHNYMTGAYDNGELCQPHCQQ